MAYLETQKLVKTEIDSYEFTMAKWGAVELKCRVYPRIGGFRYTVTENDNVLLTTNYLDEAIEKYNKSAK